MMNSVPKYYFCRKGKLLVIVSLVIGTVAIYSFYKEPFKDE
jgi:hypothetical protein